MRLHKKALDFLSYIATHITRIISNAILSRAVSPYRITLLIEYLFVLFMCGKAKIQIKK